MTAPTTLTVPAETRRISQVDMTFEVWKQAVDIAMGAAIGLGADDLADFNYYDAWDSGQTPQSTAKEVFANDLDGMGDDDDLADAMFGDDDFDD